jgi:hypothetical protein
MKYMSSLWYLDLGRNELSGNLPEEWVGGLESLRHLHLDHNNFDGYIPSAHTKLGSYQLQTLTLNDNKLVGSVPYEHPGDVHLELGTCQYLPDAKLYEIANPVHSLTCHHAARISVTLNLNNNMLSKKLDKHLCQLSIFESGQIVEFKADCNICSCSNIFCRACLQQ